MQPLTWISTRVADNLLAPARGMEIGIGFKKYRTDTKH